VLLVACATLTSAQVTFKILSFNTTFTINHMQISVARRKLRNLAASGFTSNTDVVLDQADRDAIITAFGSALATEIGGSSSDFEGQIRVVDVVRSTVGAATVANVNVTVDTTISFDKNSFTNGRNSEENYLEITIKPAIEAFVNNSTNFNSILNSGSTAFATATVNSNIVPTFGATEEDSGEYSTATGSFDHGDPKRKGAKAGTVSVGVVVGVILLGLSFYIICFFRVPTTAKVEDGVVSK
jgi:hypothetical protein